jgi:hypothetical protein
MAPHTIRSSASAGQRGRLPRRHVSRPATHAVIAPAIMMTRSPRPARSPQAGDIGGDIRLTRIARGDFGDDGLKTTLAVRVARSAPPWRADACAPARIIQHHLVVDDRVDVVGLPSSLGSGHSISGTPLC